MQAVLDSLYAEIDKNYYEAKRVYETWMQIVAKRETQRKANKLDMGEATNYEMRLEFAGNAFSIRWMKVIFTRHHSTKKLTKIYENISIPESGEFKKTKFPKANEWELKYIMYAEDALAPIRKEVKLLMKAHQSVVYAAKVKSQPIKIRPQASRVEKTQLTIGKLKSQFA